MFVAMLAMTTYTQDYVDDRRRSLDAQLAAYDDLAAASTGKAAEALAAFAPHFFNDLVLVLDASFVHRLRGREGKDGNPLNEVRVLSSSLLAGGGVLTAEKSIRLKPETSVLGLVDGADIVLTREDFGRLADAFFAEIEAKFV